MVLSEAYSARGPLGRRELLAGLIAVLTRPTTWGATEAKFRIVTEGLLAPESPKPLADGSVLVVEMARGTLSRVMLNGEIRVVADLGGSPNGCALGPDGAVYVTNNGGIKFKREGDLLVADGPSVPNRIPSIQRVDLKTGTHQTLYLEAGGVPIPGANDLVFDRHGGFYFSGGGAVCWAKSDDSDIRRIASVPRSNGIVLSPDHTHLYVCSGKELVAFDVVGEGHLALGANGVPKSRIFGKIEMGQYDSMAAEADGGVVIGTLMIGALTGFSPTGELRDSIVLAPERYVTNLGFGGPDLKTAYVSLTQTGKLAAVEWPRAGLRLANQ